MNTTVSSKKNGKKRKTPDQNANVNTISCISHRTRSHHCPTCKTRSDRHSDKCVTNNNIVNTMQWYYSDDGIARCQTCKVRKDRHPSNDCVTTNDVVNTLQWVMHSDITCTTCMNLDLDTPGATLIVEVAYPKLSVIDVSCELKVDGKIGEFHNCLCVTRGKVPNYVRTPREQARDKWVALPFTNTVNPAGNLIFFMRQVPDMLRPRKFRHSGPRKRERARVRTHIMFMKTDDRGCHWFSIWWSDRTNSIEPFDMCMDIPEHKAFLNSVMKKRLRTWSEFVGCSSRSRDAYRSTTVGESDLPEIRFRRQYTRCALYALFNLLSLYIWLTNKERSRVRFEFHGGIGGLNQLMGCQRTSGNAVWRMYLEKAGTVEWLLAQTGGLFLVQCLDHCIGVDCSRGLILDCAKTHCLPLTVQSFTTCGFVSAVLIARITIV
jgi:hypothetical protein